MEVRKAVQRPGRDGVEHRDVQRGDESGAGVCCDIIMWDCVKDSDVQRGRCMALWYCKNVYINKNMRVSLYSILNTHIPIYIHISTKHEPAAAAAVPFFVLTSAGTRAVEATATVWGFRCLRRSAWSPRMCAGEATTCC